VLLLLLLLLSCCYLLEPQLAAHQLLLSVHRNLVVPAAAAAAWAQCYFQCPLVLQQHWLLQVLAAGVAAPAGHILCQDRCQPAMAVLATVDPAAPHSTSSLQQQQASSMSATTSAPLSYARQYMYCSS
jgi:hypothetical protein